MSEQRKPWDAAEKEAWFARQTVKRSYDQDVVTRLQALPSGKFTVEQYGALTHDPARYSLYRVVSSQWNDDNPSILITGGVHGYEPSGIVASLRFLEEIAPQFADKVNFVVYPCVSPLGYEIDHRWNRKAEDPNRHFFAGGTAEESLAVMRSIESLGKHFRVAADLHETNQRDIALGAERRARDGQPAAPDDNYIPEGFYLYIDDDQNKKLGPSIIDAVRQVTPICAEKDIFGDPCDAGIIAVNTLTTTCQAFAAAHADIALTTEIYPDKAPAREAQDGQLAVVRTAIEYALKR